MQGLYNLQHAHNRPHIPPYRRRQHGCEKGKGFSGLTNKNYRRGYNLENKVANELKEKGFFVIRSSGSHTPVDVIGSYSNGNGSHTTLAVQCKVGSSSFTAKDGIELVQWANAFNARPVLVEKTDKTRWYLLVNGCFIPCSLGSLIV